MAEVGTALLCIFNDRPMPGARESGKILFVTCWRCAEAPAPRLISGKMRMPAGWPVGLARRGLLGVRAGGCRAGRTWGGSHQPGPGQNWVRCHRGTGHRRCSWGRAVLVGILEQTPRVATSPACRCSAPFFF